MSGVSGDGGGGGFGAGASSPPLSSSRLAMFESSDDINVFDTPPPGASPSHSKAQSRIQQQQQPAHGHGYSFSYEPALLEDPAGPIAAVEPTPADVDSTPAEANVFELDRASTEAALAALPDLPAEDGDGESGGAGGAAAAAPTPEAPKSMPQRLLAQLNPERWAEMAWATASSNQRLNQFMYNHSFRLSAGTQILCILLFLAVEPTAIKYQTPFKPFMAFLLIMCQLAQFCILVLAHLGMLRELQALYVRPAKVWNMYMSTVLSFAALYFTCFCFQRASFSVEGYAASGDDDVDPEDPGGIYEDLKTANDIPSIFIYFWYFSGAIMTSVGFGDITPTLWYSQAFTNLQMLLGTMYHVGVFGLTLSHFRSFQKASEEAEAEANRIAAAEGRQPHVVVRMWTRFAAIPWVIRLRGHPRTARIKRFCIKYLVLVCLVLQCLNAVLLFSIPDPFRSLKSTDVGYTRKVLVLTFITFFQTALFVGVMWVSIRLVKKVGNADITAGFLIQSFLATALLFGGIYFVLFAATPNHQFSHHTAMDLTIFEVLYVFVHFSLTVMTTTGFGDVYARGVVARLFVLAQMLISILYSAVIIGLGTSQLIDEIGQKADAKMREQQAALAAAAEAAAGNGTLQQQPRADDLLLQGSHLEREAGAQSPVSPPLPLESQPHQRVRAARGPHGHDAAIDAV